VQDHVKYFNWMMEKKKWRAKIEGLDAENMDK
jgi:hypothetical protein